MTVNLQISSQLFSNGVYGYDVFSLDIQRGRDHGLPGYTHFRTLCGLPVARNFEDFLDVMPLNVFFLAFEIFFLLFFMFKVVKTLSEVYGDARDVDLIVGGMLEKPAGDSLFGPTLSCIVADQFLRSRRGDRYFYTNDDQPAPFSQAQIREINKITLARIFCDNGDDVKQMQSNVFRKIGDGYFFLKFLIT